MLHFILYKLTTTKACFKSKIFLKIVILLKTTVYRIIPEKQGAAKYLKLG